ncbi:MAG TPA: TraR/DksA family transcriptional regulator [Acidobacteriaceae bacterium]|nr:TraR/DksA family transcriptional regulator [Acidobacteriaceae bacterium]
MASTHPLHSYETSLRKRQQELEQGLARTVEQALRSTPEDTQDVGDQAVSAYQKEMLFAQGTNHHVQLSQVRKALNRIADGTYGTCQHCENTIGPKRLEALPWTPYCIDCQERMEKGEIDAASRVA